jgi:hypothetical protein
VAVLKHELEFKNQQIATLKAVAAQAPQPQPKQEPAAARLRRKLSKTISDATPDEWLQLVQAAQVADPEYRVETMAAYQQLCTHIATALQVKAPFALCLSLLHACAPKCICILGHSRYDRWSVLLPPCLPQPSPPIRSADERCSRAVLTLTHSAGSIDAVCRQPSHRSKTNLATCGRQLPRTVVSLHLSAGALTSDRISTILQEHQRTQPDVNAALPPGTLATLLAESRSLINKMSMLKGPEDNGGAQVRCLEC